MNNDEIPIRIFVSYSHKDYRLVMEETGQGVLGLVPHLEDSLRTSNVDFWYDKNRLIGGEKFDERIRSAIERADIAILLITQHFLNSGYIQKEELPLIRKFEKSLEEVGGLKVFTIHVGNCRWKNNDYLKLCHMLPPEPLIAESKHDADKDKALYGVLSELEKVVDIVRRQKRSSCEGDAQQVPSEPSVSPAPAPLRSGPAGHCGADAEAKAVSNWAPDHGAVARSRVSNPRVAFSACTSSASLRHGPRQSKGKMFFAWFLVLCGLLFFVGWSVWRVGRGFGDEESYEIVKMFFSMALASLGLPILIAVSLYSDTESK